MKIRIGLIVIFTNCLTFVFAQNFWEQLYFPDTVTIRFLATNDSGYVFIGAGNSQQTGDVYRSKDNAQSWELVYNNYGFSVQTIAISAVWNIYSRKTGSDRFLFYEDNCDTWDVIELPPPSYGNIMKILCVGQDTICVSSWESEGAFIAKSFDTGGTWKHIFVTDNQNGCVSDIAISSNYIEYFEMGKFKK